MKHSKETIEKLSIRMKGDNNPNFGKPGTFLDKKHTEETRKKMSLRAIGRKHTKETRRKMSLARMGNNCALGYRHTEETRRKLSITHSGCNHSNWQGGITNDPYCDAWADKEYKDDIKERDNHTCQNPVVVTTVITCLWTFTILTILKRIVAHKI